VSKEACLRARSWTLAIIALLVSSCVMVAPGARLPVIEPGTPIFPQNRDPRNPIIHSFTANPTNVTKDLPITFQVVATDPQDSPLQYNWSCTDGTLSTNTGQVVMWTPPAKQGAHAVTVTISNNRGGFVAGTVNVVVQPDGTAAVESPRPASPPPTVAPPPVATASPALSPSPLPVLPSVIPSLTPSIAPSAIASPVGLTLPDVTAAELWTPPANTNLSAFIRYRISTTRTTPFSVIIFPMKANLTALTTMTAGEFGLGSGDFRLSAVPGVYVLQIHVPREKQGILDGLSIKSVLLKDGSTAKVTLSSLALSLPRANWPLPANAAADLKPLDGTMYVFKCDGTDTDLGTFEIP
jgi:PKD domain